MENNENLNPQQSFDLITSMIREARGNMQKSSFYFLLWGWTIVIANLGVYIMLQFTDIEKPFFMFAICIPSAIISMIYGMRQGEKVTAPTILDHINKWLWIGFGITCFLFVAFGAKYHWQINPVIITMCAMPTLVSGIMLRFKPLVFGGVCFWVLGAVIFMMPDPKIQFLLAAVAVTLGYLVPGYLLKKEQA
jgi:hypothetical protein